MAQDKLLAEWFWTDRWMGSSAFLLPMLARGVYREMLTQAWRRGAKLPNDPGSIKRAIGATDAEWLEAWPLISKYWRVDETNHLVNDTQLSVYAESKESAEQNHERAKKGAQARWGQSTSNAQASAQASAQAKPEECPPSPSPSPSLSQSQSPIVSNLNIGVVSNARASNKANGSHALTVLSGSLPREHRDHVFCDDSFTICVPSAVHAKFLRPVMKRNSTERDEAHAELLAWYAETAKGQPSTFVMGDAFRFWQPLFDAKYASPLPNPGQRSQFSTTIEEDAAALRKNLGIRA